MKLRKLHIICYLCIVCRLAQSDEIDWKNQTVSTDPSDSSSPKELKEPLNINNPRDKRALGLLLSGLAQVFGYTVNPVQIATLPNPNAQVDEARATQSPANGSQTPSTPASSSNSSRSNGSSMTAAPRQRETIRFTGVLNFGNNASLLNHLQEYERVFHGGSNSSSTTSRPPVSSSTQNSNQPLQPPLVVRIPLPVLSEPPLPSMPQPPLPEIPPQDIMLSYPQPLVPIRNQQQTEYRKNENTEKTTVENKQIFSGMDVQSSPPPPVTYTPYIEDPRWKMEYEERLAELERKQEEQAERLRQQERFRNRQKNDNYSGEENGKQYGGPEKPIRYGCRDSRCEEEEEKSFKYNRPTDEEGQSRERYESGERIREYSSSENPKESEESEEDVEEERYRGYKNDDVSKYNNYEDSPGTSENYTGIRYGEPLPLSEDDEKRRPGELRNSYGELLYNRELFEDAFADYFGKLKQPLTDFYTFPVPANVRDESVKEEEDSRDGEEDKSSETVREEDDTPARNKYEEYSLEEDKDTSRRVDKDSIEDTSDTGQKFSNVLTNGKNRSYYEEKKTTEEVDFGNYMPLVVPVRYLSASEELRRVKPSFPTTEKLEKDNNMLGADAVKKVSSKESRRPKKENWRSTIGFPERQTPKKLHEGERKELHAWPPPFDFVSDGTIHTNVVPARSKHNDDIKIPNVRRKPKSDTRNEETKRQRGKRVTLETPTQKSYDYAANASYDSFKKDIEYGANSENRFLINRPMNAEKVNRLRIEAEESKSDRDKQRKEVPDFWERYMYDSNNNHRNTRRPNVEMQHSVEHDDPDASYTKRFEALKRRIEKPDSSKGNNYDEMYSAENKQKSESVTTLRPSAQFNCFDLGENAYGLNYGTGNEILSGIYNGDKKLVNQEAIGLTMPQQDVYRYDESLTKFVSEPESKSVKVGGRDYANGVTAMRFIEREQNSSNGPISYVHYTRLF